MFLTLFRSHCNLLFFICLFEIFTNSRNPALLKNFFISKSLKKEKKRQTSMEVVHSHMTCNALLKQMHNLTVEDTLCRLFSFYLNVVCVFCL